jgi:hypothetical protein
MMQRNNNQPQSVGGKRPVRGQVELDRRYGQIGISAVAAAVRYHGDEKSDAEPKQDFALAFDRD